MFGPRRVEQTVLSCWMLAFALMASRATGGTAVPSYTVTDLTPFGGRSQASSALAINDSGQVAGQFINASGSLHAFLYSGGTLMDIGTAEGIYSGAQAINNGGQAAGFVGVTSNSEHAFVYSGGVMNDLGAPPGMNSLAYGINSSGQVVGWDEPVGTQLSQAFLYSGGAFHQLGTLGGATSWAYAINDSGQVVGFADTITGNSHAFLYTNGAMTDLGTLGGANSSAHAINRAGQVVGDSEPANDTNGNLHAFSYSNGNMTDLGLLPGKSSSIAAGINNSGQIVGESFNGPGQDSSGFLYENGTMYDLNSLLVNDPGYVVADAMGINDSGQIVGIADMPDGTLNAILLTPTSIPLPSAAWAALTALPLMLIIRQRRQPFRCPAALPRRPLFKR